MRAGITLLETLIATALFSMALGIIAVTTRQFYHSRTRLAEADQESQLLRSLSVTLCSELRNCHKVIGTTPDLEMRCLELVDVDHLPASPPATLPVTWTPDEHLMDVKYHLDSARFVMLRQVVFADGRTSTQEVGQNLRGLTVTNTTDRDFSIRFSYDFGKGLRTVDYSVHRPD